MADTTQVAANTVAASGHTYDATYKQVFDKTSDARLAAEQAASAAARTMEGPGIATNVIGLGVSIAADILAIFVDKVTQIKQAAQPGIHDLIAATLSDALLIDVNAEDIPVGKGAAGQRAVNTALGKKFLDQIKTFMQADGAVSGDSAESAVEAFMGFGMQLAVNTGFLALIGGAVPYEHLDEIKEIGEMLEKSLGLGRLTRQFLAPYLQVLVQKPLTRKLSAQYRQDIPAVPDIVYAVNAGLMDVPTASGLLAQHGYTDSIITVLLSKHTPRPSVAELANAEAYSLVSQQQSADFLKSDGIPDNTASIRLTLLRNTRKAQFKRPYVEEALLLAKRGIVDQGTFESILQGAGLPDDEAQSFRDRLALWVQRGAKKLSQADMLFLYEAGQVTLSDVETWARAEGFGDADLFNIELLFQLKASAASHGKTGGAAAKAANTHIEHQAFVRDEIAAVFGRPATAAELSFWVDLLDKGERTRHDFTAELKTLPTSGQAIPQG